MAKYLEPLGLRQSNYDKLPSVAVPGMEGLCSQGWPSILETLVASARKESRGRAIIAIECYPGVFEEEIADSFATFQPEARLFRSSQAWLDPDAIDRLVAADLGGDDPVFGRLSSLTMDQFLDSSRTEKLRQEILNIEAPMIVVLGAGATLCGDLDLFDLLVYADMPRWEGQLRQRRGEVDNLGVDNRGLKASLQYKRAFFIDWRVADRLKQTTMARWDFYLDTTVPAAPKLITGSAHLAGLKAAAARPFRVVPFFDPGPWGGQWMKAVCDLPDGPPNYAWCFDCVPEENSLLLEMSGGVRVEVPAINLVFNQPEALLGRAVYECFGAEFPIRFDFLDTIQGGNLSLQVHPHVAYAREKFGLGYTQDESYYILDAEPGAEVFLGRTNDAEKEAMIEALEIANKGGAAFPADKFAARFPASKHDHFLIPAGTLHCSGAGAMVLEISATPYIFTFKLWDWKRLGLDGLPRPVNLARGREVLDWSRDETYARAKLVNQITRVAQGEGWVEERTGLHEVEFIETRRHWFTSPVFHDTHGGVNVLNLIEGTEAVVESPTGAFDPYVVHYAETFIVPAAVGAYTIRPGVPGERCGTMKAYVRTPYLVAIDVGGSSVKSRTFSPSGENLSPLTMTPIESRGSMESIFSTLSEVVSRELAAVPNDSMWRLAIGFPGPTDYTNGISLIRGVAKYDTIFGCDVGAALRERLPRQPEGIRMMNDAQAAIVGEATAGAGRGVSRVLGLTLGTGLGSAFLLDGKIMSSGKGVPEGGWLYPCLFKGKLADDVFSSRGLRARAVASGCGDQDASTLAARGFSGDLVAEAVWSQFGSDLGNFLVSYIRDFKPETVLLLGGLSAAWPLFGASLQEQLGEVTVCPGTLGAMAPLLGLRASLHSPTASPS